ncbi:MAG: hypothetical protein HUK20_02235 [Fibrobacter sp.]|nr:hypothetical protein [Fibrobacter sp.]
MFLKDVSTIRTGLVTSRKEAKGNPAAAYRLLGLRCIADDGTLDPESATPFYSGEPLKEEFLTQMNDVLVRLSAPYSAALINEQRLCGLAVPSHYAIIRTDVSRVCPAYILWILRSEATRKSIAMNTSGGGVLATINSSFFGEIQVPDIPLKRQHAIGQFTLLGEREQQLLQKLSVQKSLLHKIINKQIFDHLQRSCEVK